MARLMNVSTLSVQTFNHNSSHLQPYYPDHPPSYNSLFPENRLTVPRRSHEVVDISEEIVENATESVEEDSLGRKCVSLMCCCVFLFLTIIMILYVVSNATYGGHR